MDTPKEGNAPAPKQIMVYICGGKDSLEFVSKQKWTIKCFPVIV